MYTKPTIQQWQELKRDYLRQQSPIVISPDLPTLDLAEVIPDKPDNKDNIDHYIKLQTAAFAIYAACRKRQQQRVAHVAPTAPSPAGADPTVTVRSSAEPRDPDISEEYFMITNMSSKPLNKKRHICLRMPAMRLDDGNPMEICKIYEFIQSLFGHLSKETIVNGIG